MTLHAPLILDIEGQHLTAAEDGAAAFVRDFHRDVILVVFIRMQFLRQLAIGGLDVLLARAAGHAQDLVRVCCHVGRLQ